MKNVKTRWYIWPAKDCGNNPAADGKTLDWAGEGNLSWDDETMILEGSGE